MIALQTSKRKRWAQYRIMTHCEAHERGTKLNTNQDANGAYTDFREPDESGNLDLSGSLET